MFRRSTNETVGYTHHQGDFTAHVGSSHGVRLSGGSTGGIVEAVGDDTNVSLTIRSQGVGPITIGSSGQSVAFSGSSSPFSGFLYHTDTAVATPNFATTNAMVMETTHAITGVPARTDGATTNAFVIAMPHNLSTDAALLHAYIGSTADQVHVRFAKVSTLTVASATATISFAILRR
jgi:hypothetical protein